MLLDEKVLSVRRIGDGDLLSARRLSYAHSSERKQATARTRFIASRPAAQDHSAPSGPSTTVRLGRYLLFFFGLDQCQQRLDLVQV